MTISRRGFLGAATGLAACTPAFITGHLGSASAQSWERDTGTHCGAEGAECMLVDSGTCLRESITGYKSALAAAGCRVVISKQPALAEVRETRAAIVPGCITLDVGTISWLDALLEAGGLVLIESGAPFAQPAEFAGHQELLASHFGVAVQPTVKLWKRVDRSATRAVAQPIRTPYIDYVWPEPMKVRDFSWVVPVREASEDVVAWAGQLAVAVRQQIKRGTLIFLGSALGPALLAGDREAHSWLGGVFAIPAGVPAQWRIPYSADFGGYGGSAAPWTSPPLSGPVAGKSIS